MSVPTPINLNDSTPSPPLGRSNVRWQRDAENPANVSAYALVGGVNRQSANVYAIVEGDHGRLVAFSNVAAVVVTAPDAISLPSGFWCLIENAGTGVVNVVPATSTIDGGGSLALTPGQGAAVFSDGANYWTMRGVGGGGSGGLAGVNLQAGDYTADATDNGKLIAMTKATAKTLTLPASPPSATWAIFFECVGAGDLTLDRNGLTIDGVASNLTFVQGEGAVVFTDGSDYYTSRGAPAIMVGDAGAGGKWGLVPAPAAGDAAAGKFLKADGTFQVPAGTVHVRATATINAGVVVSNGSATGSVVMCKGGLLYKVVAVAKSWLRLYKTAAGRDADLSRAYGAAPADVGLLYEIAWLGTAPLNYEAQPNAILENGDGTPSTSIYYSVFNRELTSTALNYTLTYMGIEA